MKALGLAVAGGLLLALGTRVPGMSGGAALLLILGGLALLVVRRASTGAPGHGHGHTRESVARHEAGHVVAARAVGGRVLSARVDDGGWLSGPSGRVEWDMSGRPLRAEVEGNVAFLAAGRHAGPGSGCSGDMAAIDRQIRRLPAAQRSAVRRAGESRARQIVSSRRGEIARTAARLDERGRL